MAVSYTHLNCGAANIMSPKRLGFGASSDAKANYEQMKAKVMEDVKQSFKPEFLNRIDEIIVFHPLYKEDMKAILDIMLRSVTSRVDVQKRQGVKGCRRFLERVWKLQDMLTDEGGFSKDMETKMHQTMKKVSSDFETLKYNTAIAAMMALLNDFYKKGSITKGELKTCLLYTSRWV